MAIEKPICDKCGGKEFTMTRTDPEPTTYVPASKYFKELEFQYNRGVTVTIPRRWNYTAMCKGCGATYDYTMLY